MEFLFLPGLDDVVRDELRSALGVADASGVPDRDDSLQATITGSLEPLMRLRTVVAPFLVLRFDVDRPKQLLAGEHFPRLADAVRQAATADPRAPSRSFRFDAAGRRTAVFDLLARQLAEAVKMRLDDEDGTTLLRFRRTSDGTGWEVLVRLGSRPLSARAWRRAGYVAAANATVAAAMVRLSGPRPDDRVVNLMCGSGTILVERLLVETASAAVGVDLSAEAVAACAENLSAARVDAGVELFHSDLADEGWTGRGPFDLLLSDPPWGDKIGRHSENEALHELLLRRAHSVAAPRARLIVLTHEIRIMQRRLAAVPELWTQRSEHRVFNKGHHPRIYVLDRTP